MTDTTNNNPMIQLELLDVESPCIGVCQSNNRGYCLGCYRSREERLNWLRLTTEQKSLVLELCKQRKKRVYAKKRKEQLEKEREIQAALRDDLNDDLFKT